MGLTPPHTPELEDRDAELVRLEHERKIVELQKQPLVQGKPLTGIVLADGVTTAIAHGMGRPVLVFVSPVRGAVSAGWIAESRDGSYDRSKFVVLTASGFGAAVTVDLVVS